MTTMEQMQAELAKLRAENAGLKQQAQSRLTLKVSKKGAVSLYGMGRWPVTLYRSQWEMLIEHVPHIKAFIVANASLLKVKGDATDGDDE